MDLMNISSIVLLVSILVALVGLVVRIFRLLSHSDLKDPSVPKASTGKGILYSFTLGMLPWKKESARLHWLVYLRGVLLHLGVFTFIILLLVSMFINKDDFSARIAFSPTLGLGFIAGLAALVARFTDAKLRALSRPDDYISLGLVLIVLLSGFAFTLAADSRTIFWAFVSVLCLYLPWSKIPHLAYFFFSRTLFGSMFGRRGVLPGGNKIA
jgi:nitrate reductase gamma subunit